MTTTVTHAFDRTPPVYAPGETILLTAHATVDDPPPVTGTVRTATVVTLPDGTTSAPVITESAYTVDAGPGAAITTVTADSAGRPWALVGQNGYDTTFRAVA